MKYVWSFFAGVGLVLAVEACATNPFPYTVYGLELGKDVSSSKLLANTSSGAPDETLSECAPTAQSEAPCIVIFESEYLQMKQAYIDTYNQLVALQKKCSN